MDKRKDCRRFLLTIGSVDGSKDVIEVYYIFNSNELLDACLEWCRTHRLEGI